MNNEETAGGYDAHVEIAKAAIRAYVEKGEKLTIRGGGIFNRKGVPADMPDCRLKPLLETKAGVFVSIKKLGELRGCIGTIAPVTNNIAEEILSNAISACSRDPRFDPVEPEELCDLSVSVDVLSEAEPIASKADLDIVRYGVIVSRGYRRGLLLPNLEGVDSVDYQLRIALSKAGISPSEPFDMERFEVVRHDIGGYMGSA